VTGLSYSESVDFPLTEYEFPLINRSKVINHKRISVLSDPSSVYDKGFARPHPTKYEHPLINPSKVINL
jgi:hypothetical protein